MLRKIIAMTAVSLGLSAGAASAGTVWANSVTGFNMDGSSNSCSIAAPTADRTNLCNALGAPDHPGGNSEFGFLSSGTYDALRFTFGTTFVGPVEFFEITFNRTVSWEESLDLVFLLTGDAGASFGEVQLLPTESITNNGGVADPTNNSRWIVTFDPGLGRFSELWVFDTSTGAPGAGGGFDIDAISAVSAPSIVPLPAAGLLLLAGLGGLAVMRRRRG
jgi:hypothetical protein